jgi:uncharacterized membrane protein
LTPSATKERIVFLDWLRGLAAVIMLQGHTFHSFLRPEFYEHGWYRYSQFLGGQAAAVFLFVTGITYGLGMAKRADLPPMQRVLAALRRARYLFLIGIAFRAQMYLFGLPGSRLADLLIVDILNLMGAAAALLAFVALFEDALRRMRMAALAGVLIAGVAPLVADLDTSALPKFLRDYLVPGPTFSIFPWAAYLAFGLAAGNAIPLVGRAGWDRVLQWASLGGLAVIAAALTLSDYEYSLYPSPEFWIDSPGLVACKMGALFLMAAGAYLWTEYLSPSGRSWVRLLGVTSLPVYWVHVELVYGQSTLWLHQRLTPLQCVFASAALVLLMVGMAWAIRRLPWRQWWRERTARFRSQPAEAG